MKFSTIDIDLNKELEGLEEPYSLDNNISSEFTNSDKELLNDLP